LALWQTGRLTDRQRDRETGNTERQGNGDTVIQRYKLRQRETKKIQRERETNRQTKGATEETERQGDKETERRKDTETKRDRERETETDKETKKEKFRPYSSKLD
jgi:hypothetical protein